MSKLALEGGPKTRKSPMPLRRSFGKAERDLLDEAVNYYQDSGLDPGYGGVFERRYSDLFVRSMGGSGFSLPVATGTGALYVAIAALELPRGSDVLVSPISDPGTYSAIILNGLRPKIVDSDDEIYNISPDSIETRWSSSVSAILVVHSIGQAADIEKICKFASKKGVPVIEDCSQAHGASVKGWPVGNYGAVSAFSTMYRKAHMTGGSGGVVFTKDKKIFEKVLAHADRGKPKLSAGFNDRDPNQFLFPALNWNTDELSCAVGIASLSRLQGTIRRRLSFLASLQALFDESENEIFKLYSWTPKDSPFVLPVFVRGSGLLDRKKFLADAVRAEGIDLNPNYEYLAADWPWIRDYLSDEFDPVLARLARDSSFALYLNESYGYVEAQDIVSALSKVARALA
jgi:perosamine synthetase